MFLGEQARHFKLLPEFTKKPLASDNVAIPIGKP
jgi:hypothetical protein|tara:strand:+ start:295 stop:396 length:102 start_codon:yes stop_codon:yes gene_type:complete